MISVSSQIVPQTHTIPRSAYIHLPFCRRRCFYCDFPIAVIGDRQRGEPSRTIADYIATLCQEIAATATAGAPLQTIFFGGGTPSLVSPPQIGQILAALTQQFGLDSQVEISMEMDPGTFDAAQVQAYADLGVNRVSLGVQAFQNSLLQACGRTHRVQDIHEAVAWVCQAGILNWSLDLISGLPHQTLSQWQASVEAAIALKPPHLSAYDLVLEPTTAFGKSYQPGNAPLPTDDQAAQMYRWVSARLRAAQYEHYEISNYAQPGYQCRHNRVYWHNQPYYAFGMGATSYRERQRLTRPRTRIGYLQWVAAIQATGTWPQICPDTPSDVLLETLMLGLRLTEGIPIRFLQAQFGAPVVTRLLAGLVPWQQQGYVWIDPPKRADPRIRLSDPEGLLFSNAVLGTVWELFG
ncbi:coproporphyrinogen III oxidase [Synechococcales cyanobacterium C]|uniref:Heme chaperone HemW n=1 Tax=Petrachloros mirabilis ULC683 TaxID=2781853 RepID=A0A8K1ZZJ2_9CYAN|nr:radical SAM family heme chaperone HemW [Petrachloros mirabilis]NCJ06991.1 coproporphyrinogen III oxidase [Petrachloros mirabilis ULC683]